MPMSKSVQTWVNFRRSSESVVENVSDLSKRRQPHPARLDGAAARHAVALALLAHLVQYMLRTQIQCICQSGASIEAYLADDAECVSKILAEQNTMLYGDNFHQENNV